MRKNDVHDVQLHASKKESAPIIIAHSRNIPPREKDGACSKKLSKEEKRTARIKKERSSAKSREAPSKNVSLVYVRKRRAAFSRASLREIFVRERYKRAY